MKSSFDKAIISLMALAVFCMALIIPLVAMAQAAFPIPDADVSAVLLNLGTNYKTLGILGIVALSTLLTVQAVKYFVPENFKYKRLLTLAVSILYSVLSGLLLPGANVVSVVVTVFISSGGAMALFEASKGAGIIKPT